MSKIDKSYYDLQNKILKEGYKYEDPNRKNVYRYEISDYKLVHDSKDGFPAISTKKLAWNAVVTELLWILRGDSNIKYLIDNNVNIWNKDAYNYYCKTHTNIPTSYDKWLTALKNSEAGKNLGDIGRAYGPQLRNWRFGAYADENGNVLNWHYGDIDQLSELIHTLKTNPMATKKTVTFWNPAEKDQCALTPCHWSFEVLVEPIKFWDRVDLMYVPGAISTSGDLTLVRESLDDGNIPKYQFTLKWHQHSVDTFLG